MSVKTSYSSGGEDGNSSPTDQSGNESPVTLNGSEYMYNLSMESNRVPLLVKKPNDHHFVDDGNGYRGITLAWQDLNVYVPLQKPSYFSAANIAGLCSGEKRDKPFKRVLSNVSGIVYPGSFMAILGASGAGKSTLVNALANRTHGDVVVDGEVRVNGLPTGKFMKRVSGYVYQDDLFTGTLTVREHLTFMAWLKLDRRLRGWERKRRVEELLVELGLKKCQNTRIGIPGQMSGISGGERKRLHFASEIISGCPLLFCDEPSTGLDSFSAQKIVGMMRNMAANGKTIICTIHQPNSQVFSMFDQLCLLAEGRTAYMGPARDAPAFMERLGYKIPANYNPADFYIRTLAVIPGTEMQSRENLKEICNAFANSEEAKDIEQKVRGETKQEDFKRGSMSSLSSESFSDQYLIGGHVAFLIMIFTRRRPFWWTQLYWLTWRSTLDSVRNPKIHTLRTLQKIALALLIGFCFFGVRLNQQGIQDVQGAVFVFITESTFPCMYGVLHVFPHELPLFLREHKSGLYTISSYYLAKVISLLPAFIVEPILFISIAYWIVGLRATFQAFMITIAVAILTSNTAAACGCFFSAAFDNVSLAITALIPFDYLLMITGGLFINLGTMPAGLAWMKFLSWFMYANEALSISQWKDITNITCDPDPEIPCIETGDEVLATHSFAEEHFETDFVALFGLYAFFHTATYIALIFRSRRM